MKHTLKVIIPLLSCIFISPIAYGESNQQTDRVIVEMENTQGNKVIESIPIEEIKEHTDIRILEPDYIRSIQIQNQSEPLAGWAANRIGLKIMKDQFTGSNKEIIVAVIDTGVDYNHPFLKERMVKGYDFADEDSEPMDVHFHGTHIAGIIASSTTENVKIMPIRTFDEKGDGYDSVVGKGIYYAVDHGASIINLSFAGEGYSQYLADAIDYALAHDVMVVTAAGNESKDTTNYYPASEQKVIVVSATNKDDRIADFSNTGVSIDLSAPGVDILSTLPGGEYGSLDGTSLAAPFVSGVAAMLRVDNPDKSLEEIEVLLKKYIEDQGEAGWDSLYGEGILHVTSFEKNSFIKELLKTDDYVILNELQNIAVDKQWKITFNRNLIGSSIESIKVFSDEGSMISISSYSIKSNSLVIPKQQYEKNTAYLLEVILKNGRKYALKFTTE